MSKKINKENIEAVIAMPAEALSSVKIYDIAGGTRVEVKARASKVEDAANEAIKWYDKLKEKYKTEE